MERNRRGGEEKRKRAANITPSPPSPPFPAPAAGSAAVLSAAAPLQSPPVGTGLPGTFFIACPPRTAPPLPENFVVFLIIIYLISFPSCSPPAPLSPGAAAGAEWARVRSGGEAPGDPQPWRHIAICLQQRTRAALERAALPLPPSPAAPCPSPGEKLL